MQPYQYYIDDILSAVYSPETADPDFLRDSSAMYAEACAAINDRLRSVARLLSRGLRSEAIQQAEEEPNLLDMFAVLDFQELSAWRQMLVDWDMAEPPNLLVELAADLNRAYADHQPLESLLKQHRLLALARAPLPVRIHTLRRLLSVDQDNETWQGDLAVLEKSRLSQIRTEADTAARDQDAQKLADIYEETCSNSWSIPLQESLNEHVEKLHQNALATSARADLEKLDQQLNEAHMAFDLDLGRNVRNRWRAAAGIAKLLPNDPLAQRAQPAMKWLQEQDLLEAQETRHQAAIQALESGLEEEVDSHALQNLFETAMAFDQGVPEVLSHRVQQRLSAEELKGKRKHRLVLVAIAGSVLIVGSGLAYWIVQNAHHKAITQSAESMNTVITAGDLQGAQDYYTNLLESSPSYALSPQVQTLKSQLDSLLQAEEQRRSDFEIALQRALQSPRDDPDRGALEKARSLAVESGEKAKLAALDAEISAARQNRQQLHTAMLRDRLSEFRQELDRITGRNDYSDQEKTSELSNLRNQITAAKKEWGRASGTVASQTSPLLARIKALRESAQARIERRTSTQRITDSVGNSAAFFSSLEAHSERFSNSVIADNLDAVSKEKKLCKGLSDWSVFLSGTFGPKKSFTASEASNALKNGTDLLATHPGIPLAQFFKDRQAYLESIAQRVSEQSSLLNDLEKLFRDPLIANLWMVEDKNGTRYYARDQPTVNESTLRFEYLSGFDLSSKLSTVRAEDVLHNGIAPQSLLAKEIRNILQDIPKTSWEPLFCQIVVQLADPKRDLDPILRLILMQKTLDSATQGSTALSAGFRSYRRAMDESNVDLSVAWMSPRDKTAQKERDRAELLLRALPDVKKSIKKTADLYKKLAKSAADTYRWVGWLDQGLDGEWTCHIQKPRKLSGELVVLNPTADFSAAEILTVGRIDNGKIASLHVTSSVTQVAGRPVFLKETRGK